MLVMLPVVNTSADVCLGVNLILYDTEKSKVSFTMRIGLSCSHCSLFCSFMNYLIPTFVLSLSLKLSHNCILSLFLPWFNFFILSLVLYLIRSSLHPFFLWICHLSSDGSLYNKVTDH